MLTREPHTEYVTTLLPRSPDPASIRARAWVGTWHPGLIPPRWPDCRPESGRGQSIYWTVFL